MRYSSRAVGRETAPGSQVDLLDKMLHTKGMLTTVEKHEHVQDEKTAKHLRLRDQAPPSRSPPLALRS